jgi:hypothetical protein
MFQLKVSLREIKPLIWRRLMVPGDAPLGELHDIIQISFGWDNAHLHEFRIGDKRYGMVGDEELDREVLDEEAHFVEELLAPKTRFEYEYDFGDGWEHEIVVEDVLPGQRKTMKPRCIDGARACPPEDCGGPFAYLELLRALKKPRSARARELREWLGGPFDGEAFDLAAINRHFR